MKRVIYLVLGWVGLGLGALEAALPLLPASPFLLLAAVGLWKEFPPAPQLVHGDNAIQD